MAEEIYEKDFLSIKEFSEFVGLPRHTLRYYDKMGVFHPAKIGAASDNKYRYYSKTQLTTVKMIHVLTEIGVPLETIKELEGGRTPEKLLKILRKSKNEAIAKIRLFQDVCTVIETYVDMIGEGISITENEITLSEMPSRKIALGELNDYNSEESLVGELTRFYSTMHESKMNISFPIGGYWETMKDFMKESKRPTRFYSLDPKGRDQKEKGLYLCGYTRGYYSRAGGLSALMDTFAKKNGLEFCGPVYSLFLFDEICTPDPDQYLLQISAAVKETRHAPPRRPHRIH
jgi:DNA-binding transcriptional MerR regulator